MATHDTSEGSVSFKDTLNLPRTDFPIRSSSAQDDPVLVARWEKEGIFKATFELNKGASSFILHDGPPYANGHIHVGHAYNKILKDIVTKSRRMAGNHVPVTPGWDCHGLPIELKVTQEQPGLSPLELKKACRAYAQKWIDVQRAEFKRLGVLMDWEHPYLTMSPRYEASILRAFGSFVDQGYIERKNKTVPWCPSCQTVLAAAEIEYQDRKDPSLYVLFKLHQGIVDQVFPALVGKPIDLVIWTTTPWTLPLNRAVLLKPQTSYSVVDVEGRLVMVGSSRIEAIAALLAKPATVVATISSESLIALKAQAHHPFIDDFSVPLLLSDTVQDTDGTAFVHCAPGCGPEDYEVGVKNKLEIYSPITASGTYDATIIPAALQGMPVSDGQIWVIKELAARGKMLHKASIKHSYPHCWRCHGGLIFRATKQWFCDLSKRDLKEKAIEAVDTISMLPPTGSARLKATLEGRLEWCLSRQRIWGVPIPALLCTHCDHTYINSTLIETVAKGVEKEGIEYWDQVLPAQLVPSGFSCSSCGKTNFKKEQDILDVWFDSGVSHYAVLEQNKELRFPADLYLEGKDQHRGWFQSSLLTALVLEGKAPMKHILTHGFTVDAAGKKMSKSLGNVVTPQQMMDQLGTDGLRLWAVSIDYADDAVISPVLLENIKEVYRKIRNTCRFLLSNLYDYDHVQDALPIDQLLPIDAHALTTLRQLEENMLRSYRAYDFTAISHLLGNYCASDLSAFYLDMVKDRLYVEAAAGHKRRSAQTACWYILDTMTRLMAPVLSFTAEQVSDLYQKDKKTSIHLQSFAQTPELKVSADNEQLWQTLVILRSAVLKAIEPLREQGVIKHSLEARVSLHLASDMKNHGLVAAFLKEISLSPQGVEGFLKEFFIVSQIVIAADAKGLQPSEMAGVSIQVEHAKGNKCPRCWQWDETEYAHHICNRCHAVLQA